MSDPRPAPGWARNIGHTHVGPMRLGVEQTLDRLLVAERIARYGWAYDERDRELLEDCFTQDGTWEGSIMGETPIEPILGRTAVADWLCEFWVTQGDQRRHAFTNVIVDELTETSATAYAYIILTAAGDAVMVPQTTGPYRFELVKESDSWRMARLIAGFDAPF